MDNSGNDSKYLYGRWSGPENIDKHYIELFKKNMGINTAVLSYMYGDGKNDLMVGAVLNKRTFDVFTILPPDVSGVALGNKNGVHVCFIVLHMFGTGGRDFTIYADMNVKGMQQDPHSFENVYIHFINAETGDTKDFVAESSITDSIRDMIKKTRLLKNEWTNEEYFDTLIQFKDVMTADEIRRLSE